MMGSKQFDSVDFNQIPFTEAVMETLPSAPTSSPDSGSIPNGRFYYDSTTQVAYVKTPVGWKSMCGVQKKVYPIGDGTASVYVITHDMGSQDLSVTVRLTASPFSIVTIDVDMTDANTVTVTSAMPLAVNYLTVIIMG